MVLFLVGCLIFCVCKSFFYFFILHCLSTVSSFRPLKQFFLQQQSSWKKKLAEIELNGLELEDELSEIRENAEESGSARISLQLTIEEKDRTRHWI